MHPASWLVPGLTLFSLSPGGLSRNRYEHQDSTVDQP